MKVLITGGLGYIGSHIANELSENDIEYVIVDNLSNSKKEVVDYIEKITGKPNEEKIKTIEKITWGMFLSVEIVNIYQFAGVDVLPAVF